MFMRRLIIILMALILAGSCSKNITPETDKAQAPPPISEETTETQSEEPQPKPQPEAIPPDIQQIMEAGPASDVDFDIHEDTADNCPTVFNPDQSDNDQDLLGNLCDPDDDNDSVMDEKDNCQFASNPLQTDSDRDGLGDACDKDADNDGISDSDDNCRDVSNPGQQDIDSDKTGDICDPDIDGDDTPNDADNCALVANSDQTDSNGDGTGDACAGDDDGDGIVDALDNCPVTYNPDQKNNDAAELDGSGDACDDDDDNDAIMDTLDNCPMTANTNQIDTDGDGLGEACDTDDDNDSVSDESDSCPGLAGGDSKLCDTKIDGIVSTILNPQIGNNFDLWKDYQTTPSGFYMLAFPSAVAVVKNPSEGYTVYYIAQSNKILRLVFEGGVLNTAKSGQHDFAIAGVSNYIRGIVRPKDSDNLFFISTTGKTQTGKYDLYIWRVKIKLDDYGYLETSSVGKSLWMSANAQSYQFNIGIKKITDGYIAYLAQPSSNNVFAQKMASDLTAVSRTQISPPSGSGISISSPRATFVDNDSALYIAADSKIIRAQLDTNGVPQENSWFQIPTPGLSPMGIAKIEGHSNYLFFSAANELYVLRDMSLTKLTAGIGYSDCVSNCGLPAPVGLVNPGGLASDGNKLIVADRSNRVVKALSVTIDSGATIVKSEFVAGQILKTLVHEPQDGQLTNFYYPKSVRLIQRDAQTSFAYTTDGGAITHMVWKVNLRQDKVKSLEPIASDFSKMRYPQYLAFVDAVTEWRLYVSSDYSQFQFPRIYLIRLDKETGERKGEIETAWTIPAGTYPSYTLGRIATSPDNKYIYFTGFKKAAQNASNQEVLTRLKIDPQTGLIASNGVTDLMPKDTWKAPISVGTYRASDKDYILVGEKDYATIKGVNTRTDRLFRAELDENGLVKTETVTHIAGGGSQQPSPQTTPAPKDILIGAIGEVRYIGENIWFSDVAYVPRLYKMANDQTLDVVLLPTIRGMADGVSPDIGSSYGFGGFDTWGIKDSEGNFTTRGILFVDTGFNALRLVR